MISFVATGGGLSTCKDVSSVGKLAGFGRTSNRLDANANSNGPANHTKY